MKLRPAPNPKAVAKALAGSTSGPRRRPPTKGRPDGYRAFLERKACTPPARGFEIDPHIIHPKLHEKPHQAAIVQWAVRLGRAGIFARFGLGKTVMQLETVRILLQLVREREGGEPLGLIIAPLGTKQEFRRDAAMLGLTVKFIRTAEEAFGADIYLTNYEPVRDGLLSVEGFTAVSLDEASCLREYGSKTFQTFLTLFKAVRFRFVATATPSPNRFKELIHYAGFLGVMDTGQALTRFFQRDPKRAGNLTLFPHKVEEFWHWLGTWGVFLQKPSDLGFSDEGYDLPPLDLRWHEVLSDHVSAGHDRDGQGLLFRDSANGIVEAAREKRDSMGARLAKMMELRAEDPEAHRIIWHHLEAERHEIERLIPDVVSIYGNMDPDDREQATVDFSDGRVRELATKPVLSGSGGNLQRHCAWMIHVGIDFKFNDLIQSIHRLQRFLQTRTVRCDLIYTEAEREVRRVIEAKWARYEELAAQMSEIIRKYGLSQLGMAEVLTRSMGVERAEASGEGWLVARNDCVLETRSMDTDSVDLVLTSIPFSNHYEYTPSYNDFGHTDDDGHFFEQMDFLTPELLRVLKPGRLACIHVKDRINFGSVTGMGRPTVNPFHAKCIAHYIAHGFAYMGMVTVSTDVVRENNQNYRLGYTKMTEDASVMGVGSPEYILLFCKLPTDRSKGWADQRITRSKEDYSLARWQIDAHAFWRSSGDRYLTPQELSALAADVLPKAFTQQSLQTIYDYETHVRVGEFLDAKGKLPSSYMALAPGSLDPDVWHDVHRMLTLNGSQSQRGLENHVCPLQFDIVDRLIERYSMKGELVYDPFGGLATVPVRALKAGRRGRSTELNPGYFADGVMHCKIAEAGANIPSLFDLLTPDEVAA